MSIISRRSGLPKLALALLIANKAVPAFADVVVPARALPIPIVPPPFVVVPDPDTAEDGLAADRLTVVIGAGMGSDYEGSDNYTLGLGMGATARVQGHSIAWQGNSLGVDLVREYRKQTFKFIVAPFININLDRTATSNDPIVALIPKRKKAAEGGAELGFTQTGIIRPPFDSLTLKVSAAYDLGSVHKSFVVTPSATYTAPLSKAVLVSVSASFDLVGSGYARYYFGIDSAASTSSGLPLHRPSGGSVKSAAFGLGGVVSLSGDLRKGFALGAKLHYQRLLGDFANSPLVAMRGNPNQFSAAMGVAYTF